MLPVSILIEVVVSTTIVQHTYKQLINNLKFSKYEPPTKYGTVSSGFCSPGNHATNFFNKIIQKLTWNPMQAQTEPKLHPETANMEFEQVITKRSATLKGDLKVNLEPKWFLS